MRILLIAIAMASAASAAPTFSQDVAPIFYEKCVSCHRPGEVAPMSLLDYASARPWAAAIREAILRRKMPPWFADPQYGHFANDPRLSDEEIATVKAWADGGSPEGDPKTLPAPPVFGEGWTFGKPDLVIDIGEDFEVPAGNDINKDFVVPVNLTEGKWIRAAQIRPGNRRVVHHVHVSVLEGPDTVAPAIVPSGARTGAQAGAQPDRGGEKRAALAKIGLTGGVASYMEKEPGEGLMRVREDAPVVNDACAIDVPDLPGLSGFQEGSFVAFLPGRQPDRFTPGAAKFLGAGSQLRFQVHYANIRKPATDRTSIGLYFYDGQPQRLARRMDVRNHFFRIPPGAENHAVKRCYEFETDKQLISITPHMHYRGKSARYELVRPDGTQQVLLYVPKYDFNWQLNYQFQQPVRIEKGSRLVVTFTYDNSTKNQFNPDPSIAVRWGDRTEEEMMTTWTEVLEMVTAEASGGETTAAANR
jgi:hypothetical protein